jgi:hypothetical protein
MASEPFTGAFVIAAAGGAMVAGGVAGPLDFPLPDFGWATIFALIGLIGRAMLDAKAARDKAKASGAPLPKLDITSLVYSMFGAPLVGGIVLAGSRALGFVPDYAAAPLIMLMGYWGQDGVTFVLDLVKAIVSRRTGGNS